MGAQQLERPEAAAAAPPRRGAAGRRRGEAQAAYELVVMAALSLFAASWPYSSWPVTFACCSGGVSNILYSFGLGYGLSMTANAGISYGLAAARVAATAADGAPTAFGLAGCGLYGVYGVRLSTFLWRRQSDSSYAPKFASVQERSDSMSLFKKLAIVAGVSLSQALYVLPLRLATLFPAPAPGLRSSLGWAGVGLACAGLLLEAVADEQKLAAKRRDPKAPVTSGLYSVCRHPNYLGEIMFHVGVLGLAAGGSGITQVAVASIAPLFMVSVMVGAAKRLDKDGTEKYGDDPAWLAYAESTPALVPFFGTGSSSSSAGTKKQL